MTKLTFQLPDGTRREIEAAPGQSVMQLAIANDIEGIVAECCGSLACATCHVILDEATAARLEGPGQTEREMLEFVASERSPTSRLSCQLAIGDLMEGSLIRVPKAQY